MEDTKDESVPKRKQRKVAWRDSYERFYGMAPTQRGLNESGLTIVVEAQCLFCVSFGREEGSVVPPKLLLENPTLDARRPARRKTSNIKHFTSFRPDQFVQHLTREHPKKWEAYQLIRKDPSAVQTFFPEAAIVNTTQDASLFFRDIPPIEYNPQAPDTELFCFREYCADEFILGKPMHEWCRFAVCFWHTFANEPSDVFGEITARRPWNAQEDPLLLAKRRIDAAFEFMTLLGIRFYTFHDTDILPQDHEHLWDSIIPYLLAKQEETSIRLLWGTANLFSNRKYMHGAATSPSLSVFIDAAKQVKRAMYITHVLGGENYVFWGGREGFQTLLNTDMAKEETHYAMFLRMAVEYKKTLGATYQLLIEPKPHEPMKHQYDYDAATTLCFLYRHDLQAHFKLNIEPNHTTLAGHDYHHDIAYASMAKYLGSIDCNTGDSSLGWDTDQFLMDVNHATLIMRTVIQQQGLAPGGLNFDAKVRRESTSLKDIVIAHIGAMDCIARGLRKAANMYLKGHIESKVQARYSSWDCTLGRQIENGEMTFESLVNKTVRSEPLASGEQESYELMFFRGLVYHIVSFMGKESATRSPRGTHVVFKRTRLGVVLPNIYEHIPIQPPSVKSKPLELLQHEFEIKQHEEMAGVIKNFRSHLDHVLTSLPASLELPRLLDEMDILHSWTVEAVQKRIQEAIVNEQADIEQTLTPVDEVSIGIEVIQALFPDEDEMIYTEKSWANIMAHIVGKFEILLVQKTTKDRSKLPIAVELKRPEGHKVQSPRTKLQEIKSNLSPRRHICEKNSFQPFELTSKADFEERREARRLNLPKVIPENTFRQVHRNRAFPPTKIPKGEYIEKVYTYCPVESRFDLNSVSLKMDEIKERKPWTVIEFPKARPTLNKDQVNYLEEWLNKRYDKMHKEQEAEVECHSKLLLTLEYADAIMHELSRLLFDKCPTSSHFLYGLWHCVSDTMAHLNKSIEDELTVLNQTQKTLKGEVDNLERKHQQQSTTMQSLEEKLQQKHKIIAFEREQGIRFKNELNKYLAADQVLIRQTNHLTQAIFDTFPDQPFILTQGHQAKSTEALNELLRTLEQKFSNAPLNTNNHVQEKAINVPSRHRKFTIPAIQKHSLTPQGRIISSFEVEDVAKELHACTKRLSLLTTLSSPDCSIGWDPQIVWQHAFFIPPIQELIEMDEKLQDMVATVEAKARPRVRRRRNRATQTESSMKSSCGKSIKQTMLAAAKAHALSRQIENPPILRQNELKKIVPTSFQPFIQCLGASYVAYDYTVPATHRILSFMANSLEIQLTEAVLDDVIKAHMLQELLLISPQEFVYRIFLERFRIPRFANERLMDLLTSLSQLDTQSDKIHLWCRLLNLAGVEPLPSCAFWFILHAFHIFAKCSHDGYFLIENDEVEYVGQQQTWDALTIIFASFPADTLARCKSKITGLTQIYGTMWIPLYAVLTICIEEWQARYFSIKLLMETHFSQAICIDSFTSFRSIVATFNPKAHVYAILKAYKSTIEISKSAHPTPLQCSLGCLEACVVPVDDVAQFDKSQFLFSAPSDAMLLKQMDLAMTFLKLMWNASRNEIIKSIENHTHLDSSASLRFVTPFERILRDEPLQASQAWNLLEQIIYIAYTPRSYSMHACLSTLAKKGLVPADCQTKFISATNSLIEELRASVKKTYNVQDTVAVVQDWRDKAMVHAVKKKQLSSEMRRVYGDVYDQAQREMQELLNGSFEHTTQSLSEVMDHVAFNLKRQCEYHNMAMVMSLEETIQAHQVMYDKQTKELEEAQETIIHLKSRLESLESSTSHGDITLCNELRHKCQLLEKSQTALMKTSEEDNTNLKAARRTIHRLESELEILRATFEFTKAMHHQEVVDLTQPIHQAPVSPIKVTKPTQIRYDPYSQQKIEYCRQPNSNDTRPTRPTTSPRRTIAFASQ
ncbi:xylose isomerase 1, partial [Thraustotheca clavata]